MKHKILIPVILIVLGILSANLYAQAPESIIYQAEARDAKGGIIKNTTLEVKFIILEVDPDIVVDPNIQLPGTPVWDRVYEVTTNEYGLFSVAIGSEGVDGVSDLSVVDWHLMQHFLNVQVDDKGAWVNMGTTQFLSVPYALHAETATNVLNDDDEDADADPTNELNTSVNLNGTNLEVTDDGGTIIQDLSSLVDDADSDPTNELQNWSTLPDIPAEFTDGDDVDDADASSINELQNLTLEDDILKLSLTNDEVSLGNYVSHWRLWGDDLLQFTGAVDIGDNYTSGAALRVDGNITVGKSGENPGTYGIGGPSPERT